MMFGFRDEFEYFECSSCGCIQIKTVPDNLEKYYPSGYLPFRTISTNQSPPTEIRSLKRLSGKYLSRGKHILKYRLNKNYLPGFLLEKKFKFGSSYGIPAWLVANKINLGLSLKSKILDVGCGNGELLLTLRKMGMRSLWGIDAYIHNNINYCDGVNIKKGTIEALDEEYDFIMLNHSFEHMLEPELTLQRLYKLLRSKRYLLIRIPIAAFSWREYGVNWVQLDAPRHFYLHTIKSFRMLVEQTGFRIADVVFDSTEFQFWGSEQYRRDIPLIDDRSYGNNPAGSIFSKAQIESFVRKAVELNESGQGDQACFYLYKS